MDINAIYKIYMDGMSLEDVCRIYQKDGRTLKKVFAENGLPLKSKEQTKLERLAKMKQTCLEKYGVENASKLKETQDKKKITNLKRYGEDNPAKSKVVQNKMKQTCLERHGKENIFATEKFKENLKVKNLEEYGVEWTGQRSDVKQKIEEAHQNNWSVKRASKLDIIKDKAKETCNIRYNTDSPMQNKDIQEKNKQTCKDKYGHDYSWQAEEVKEKICQTNLINLGTRYSMQNEQVKEKRKNTYIENWGETHPMKSQEIKDKVKKTLLENYGVENPMYSNEIVLKQKQSLFDNKISDLTNFLNRHNYILLDKYLGLYERENGIYKGYKKYQLKHTTCNNIFIDEVFSIPRCPVCYPNPYASQQEDYLRFYIETLSGLKFVSSREIIKNPETDRYLELDLYNADLKIAFEWNHTYTHHTKDRMYHSVKTDLSLEQGIKLYHVWNYHHPEIIKSRIASVLGKNKNYYARNFIVKQISTKEANLFIQMNHLQGATVSYMAMGLFDSDNNLMSVISFRKVIEDASSLEIARFCSMPYISIIGGFAKLLKHSITYIKRTYPEIKNILTYADKDWSPDYKETVYFKNGFEFKSDTGPSMYYTINNKIYNRMKFQKYRLKIMFPDVYDDNLTEQQILALKNIFPIYNSGNWKYILKI